MLCPTKYREVLPPVAQRLVEVAGVVDFRQVQPDPPVEVEVHAVADELVAGTGERNDAVVVVGDDVPLPGGPPADLVVRRMSSESRRRPS